MPTATAPSIGFVCQPDAEHVALLEDLPIDSLWVGGHVASTNPTPEVMTQLARLSALAHRVQIGTSILLLPLYPPAIVAKQLADLDRATGGRLTVGVGVGGEYPQEFRACGVPLRERGARTDESIGLLRRLWTGEEISHAGPHFPMDAVRIHPAPAQPGGPPIVVAGRRAPAWRRAALLGDGWMPYLYSADRYRTSVAEIGAIAEAAGRDLTGFGWYAFVFVNVAADRRQARREASEFLGGNYGQDFEAMLDRVAVTGDHDDVRRGVRALLDAGVQHLVFAPARRDLTLDDLHRIATEVIEVTGDACAH